jgi:hypothetical protein
VFIPRSGVFWMTSVEINAGPTPKSTVKRGMSSICRRTIHTKYYSS